MKLITFTESSRTRIGLLQGEQIVDLSQAAPALPDDMLTRLRQAIQSCRKPPSTLMPQHILLLQTW